MANDFLTYLDTILKLPAESRSVVYWLIERADASYRSMDANENFAVDNSLTFNELYELHAAEIKALTSEEDDEEVEASAILFMLLGRLIPTVQEGYVVYQNGHFHLRDSAVNEAFYKLAKARLK